MLWYLLYPFRGTTCPPDLTPDHPLRTYFTRYGVCIARNVATTLLISVAVTTALLYPIPYLYTIDFITGVSNIPRHTWINASPVKNGVDVEPDVTIRSIWVHGSYMQALQPDVLLSALELQDELLGPTMNFNPRRFTTAELGNTSEDLPLEWRDTFHVANGLTNQSWLFTSPLLYWSNDRDEIASDTDILATVNAHKAQSTAANITLHHSAVFSGKRFRDRALVAADALVITLVHLRDSPMSRQWERRAAELASRLTDKWTVYPNKGHGLQSQLFEFQTLPISLPDSFMLALAYSVTFAYVLQNLSKLPEIKSRPGLILTVIAQIFMSIMSSFTVCALLSVDLSRIPRAAYPIVIIAMSLENILRLINTVILTDPEHSTSSRIGEAFGKTTHVALASVAEHLVLLWGISKLVTTGLSDFCCFLAIAIVFDFLYLSTFFLSVLSVEVRRTELGEAIEKAVSMRRKLYAAPSSSHTTSLSRGLLRPSCIAAILQGRIHVTTRIAGSVILFGFVIIAQWHFFGIDSIAHTMGRMFSSTAPYNITAWSSASSKFKEVHQARSPASWLRLQDHEMAREINCVIHSHIHEHVARIYEPLVFVLKGANRMPGLSEPIFLSAVYDFARNQWKPFFVAVLTVPVVVHMLVKYLLWDQTGEGSELLGEPVLSVRCLDKGHALDIALLAASSNGMVASVGLDRWIRVWNVPFGGKSYLITEQDSSMDVPFPVRALAIDDSCTWLAILSTYMVMLWNLESKKWGTTLPVDLCGQKPEAFFFTPNRKRGTVPSLVVVRRNGTLVELWADSCELVESTICRSPLVCAVPFHCRAPVSTPCDQPFSILTASRTGSVYRVIPVDGEWAGEEINQQAGRVNPAHGLVGLPQFAACLIVRASAVDLVDLRTSKTIHSFRTAMQMQTRSLRYMYSRKRPFQRDSSLLSYFSLVYSSAQTGNCVIQTYFPQQDGGSIDFFSDDGLTGIPTASDDTCCTWNQARQVTREISNPGRWEVLPSACIIGIRRPENTILNLGNGGGHAATGRDCPGGSDRNLRHRGFGSATDLTKTLSASTSSSDNWEVWSMWNVADYSGTSNGSNGNGSDNASGQGYVTRLLGMDNDDLLVTEPGPIVQVGAGSVAVGFGRSIKIITLGHERLGSAAALLEEEAEADVLRVSIGVNRRRKNRRVSLS